MIHYQPGLKKFFNNQYVYTGIRITSGVLIPAIVLSHYGLLGTMMGVPLGALFIALPDNPGPMHHRVNGMIAGILLNFIVVLIAGYSIFSPWLTGIEVVALTFIFAMFGVFGARADSIGLIGLVTFIMVYGTGTGGKQSPFLTALFFSAGGAWYALLSIVFSGIQPYKAVEQLLGEYLSEIGEYLEQRARFYDKDADTTKQLTLLIQKQAVIQRHQSELREMLFKTRLFVKETTNKGRRLMMIFLESTDMLERIITTQQDYQQLHNDFDDTGILQQFGEHIAALGRELQLTGISVQSGSAYDGTARIEDLAAKTGTAFTALRNSRMNAANMESFIGLRHILYSITDVSERLTRLQKYTGRAARIKRGINTDHLHAFVSHQEISLRQMTTQFTLSSGQFRHAIRLTLAMFTGYIAALFLPLGHGYWILLTIATILKPAFSASRKRNIQRVAGTLAGAGAGFLTLYAWGANNTAIFIVMLAGMLIAYSTLRLNYLVSTAAITLYIVLSFHFFYPSSLNELLADRVIDTVAGSLIAFAAAYFVLPKWEHEQIGAQLVHATKANCNYFKAVSDFLQSQEPEKVLQYKLSRKSAFVSLANLADGLQRMMDEPKNRQKQLQEYHQLVASGHMLTSYIASLAYYAEQHRGKYNVADIKPMLQYVSRQFAALVELVQQPGTIIKKHDRFPVSRKIQELLQQRRSEVQEEASRDHSQIRHQVSLLKAMSDQLQLIDAVLEEQIRVLTGMHSS